MNEPTATANQLADLCGLLALVARQRGSMAPLGTDNANADELLREIGVPYLQGPLDHLYSIARRLHSAPQDDGA